ncbi:hypothetical protein [Streptomyces alfalfae]
MAAETGVPALDTLLVWGGAVSLAGGLLTLAWRAVRGTARFGRRVDEFIDDWRGEPSRPGVPARPGVMERMEGLEDRMGGVEDDLQRIKHELYPNSGGSLRDAVDQANARLAVLCPDEHPPDTGTPVPRRDRPGDAARDTGDTAAGTPDVTSEDTPGDTSGDVGGQTSGPPSPGP